MARMGVNVQKTCTESCPGLIILALKAESGEINELFEKLNKIEDLEAKISIFEEKF
jgi:hypothetical protein